MGKIDWWIKGPDSPKGPDSFVSTHRIFETYPPWESAPPYEVDAPPMGNPGYATEIYQNLSMEAAQC